LAPQGVSVLMSSEAWHAYEVSLAPWCVVTTDGTVVADAPAPSDRNGLNALLGRVGD
jgi:hypothetical protein